MPRFQGVWLINSLNGLPHYAPDEPGVIASLVGRGYEVTDLPVDLDSDDPDFIEALEKLQGQAEEEEPGEFELVETAEPVVAKSATEEEGINNG
jgi:hypothetical protein